MPSGAVPSGPVTAKDWAVGRIRSMIYSGELSPGGRVSIEQLAAQVGVSRTPIRDALWHLEREGLVDINARVGVFVRSLTRREAESILELKAAVEPLMARWAAERGAETERQAYRDEAKQLAKTAKSGDAKQYIDQLERLRRHLSYLAQSPAADDVLAVIDGRVRLIRFRNLTQPGVPAVSAGEHLCIADAIATGDGPGAFEAMRQHMHLASARIARVIDDTEPPLPGGRP